MNQISEWKEQGKTMLKDLTEERAKLQARIVEVDAGIAALQTSLGVPGDGCSNAPSRRVLRPTIAEMVKTHSDKKFTFSEIASVFDDDRGPVSEDSIKIACQRLSKDIPAFKVDATGIQYVNPEESDGTEG